MVKKLLWIEVWQLGVRYGKSQLVLRVFFNLMLYTAYETEVTKLEKCYECYIGSPRQLIGALLFAFGVYWCYVVVKRFPEDLQELREIPDKARKGAIIFIWFVTVIIAIAIVSLGLPLIIRIIKAVYDVFTIS